MCGSSKRAVISVIIFMTIGVIIGGVNAKLPERIVGGNDANANEFPWTARLNVMDSYSQYQDCSGAIISSRHILTAGHCLNNTDVISIFTGSHIRHNDSAIRSNPAQIIVHPSFRIYKRNGSEYVEHDIGIVVLDKDLKLSASQNTIPLANRTTNVGERGIMAGWGYIDQRRLHRAKILQKTSIIILPDDDCPIKVSTQLCGSSGPTATPCHGDSGSPLVIGGRVAGLISTGSCIVGEVSHYANVYHHLDWIRSTIERTSGS